MRLISSIISYLIAPLLFQLSSAASLHSHLKSVAPTHASDALSTNRRDIDTIVKSSHRTDTGPEDDHYSALPLPRFLTSTLNRWGSPISGGDPHKPGHLVNEQKQARKSTLGKLAILIVAIGILMTLLSFVCACFGRWWEEEVEDELKGPDPTLAAVEYCNGPWAIAYRESQGQQREAIELLFRCNIITMPEFAGHGVSRQHSDISGCIQIAIRMLQDRPTPEWEAQWQDAHRTFQQAASDAERSVLA